MNYDYLYDNLYLKDTITPKRLKRGLTPQQEKRKDTRAARRQMHQFSAHPTHASRPPHTKYNYVTPSGVPYYDTSNEWIPEHIERIKPPKKKYLASGYHRSKGTRSLRRGNGQLEWLGWGDAWAKPDVQGKSSRITQREKQLWWDEAYETFAA